MLFLSRKLPKRLVTFRRSQTLIMRVNSAEKVKLDSSYTKSTEILYHWEFQKYSNVKC